MTASNLTVLKVGGSLLDWTELPRRFHELMAKRRAVNSAERYVLIAGGGRVVDVIRGLDEAYHWGESITHRLALHAMDLTATILAELLPGTVAVQSLEGMTLAWSAGAVPVLAPRLVLAELDRDGGKSLPESWDVTSDTIAARLAVHLRAGCLVLLKSADLPAAKTRVEASRAGLVDPVFPIVARPVERVEYLNLRNSGAESILLP